jgi:hypothetical protein
VVKLSEKDIFICLAFIEQLGIIIMTG